MNFNKHIYIYIAILLAFNSCVEPIEIKGINFENYLVVEANLTDQLKKHTVKLTRSFTVNDTIPKYESNATIRIIDNNQNTYTFSEKVEGIYESDDAFKAEVGNNYTLFISTNDGNEYSSTPEKISGINEINDITIEKSVTPENVEGLKINVLSNAQDTNSLYYRYEYDETYKIVAPYWSEHELIPTSTSFPFSVDLVKKNYQSKICYKTVRSNKILLTETTELDKNNVDFTIRFLKKDDFIIAHRYSILIKQYVQSANAYRFYKTLKKFSTSQEPFTQVQPGLIPSNISNSNDKETSGNVIGFFEVSSYSEKRFFFNYLDLYKPQGLNYPSSCEFIAPLLSDGRYPAFYSPLINELKIDKFIFFKITTDPNSTTPGPYTLVPKVCGDCRVLGTNEKPSFWID